MSPSLRHVRVFGPPDEGYGDMPESLDFRQKKSENGLSEKFCSPSAFLKIRQKFHNKLDGIIDLIKFVKTCAVYK